MRKSLWWILVPISLFVVGAVVVGMRLNNNAAAAPTATHETHEVAILFCVTNAGPPAPSIIVGVYDGTAGAPVITLGTSCAIALKTLLDADFRFEPNQVRPSDQSGHYEYTLTRLAPAPPPGATPAPTPGGTPAPFTTPTPGATPVTPTPGITPTPGTTPTPRATPITPTPGVTPLPSPTP